MFRDFFLFSWYVEDTVASTSTKEQLVEEVGSIWSDLEP